MHSLGKVLLFLGAILIGLDCPGFAYAQASFGSKNEIAAIRTAAKEYLSAVQRGDQSALRKLWSPTGDYVDAFGQRFKADELIQQLTAEPPVKNASNATDDVATIETKIRFIAPDVAIEDGTATAEGNALAGRFTAIWVKRNGRWLLDGLREAAAFDTAPVNEHLAPLAWLLGEWTGKTKEGDILVSAHWSDAGKYIVREFVIRSKSGEKVGGTQRIGWDPVVKQIKSWSFDSQGGAGKDKWRREGNRWVVESDDVMADGKTVTTSSTYVPGAEGSFVWESLGGNVAGIQLKPARVEFVRAADDE